MLAIWPMRTRIVLSLLACLTLSSVCAVRLGAQTEVIDFPLKGNRSVHVPFDYSEMIESVRYIRIEDSAILGDVIDVKLVGDKFYLWDRSQQAIIVVDMSGRILSQVARQGRANNEYLSINAYDVHPGTGEIHIYDWLGSRIQVYSGDGRFLRSVPLETRFISARDMAVTSQGTYLLFKPDYDKRFRGLVELGADGKERRMLVHMDNRFRLHSWLVPPFYFGRLSDGSTTMMGHIDKNQFYRYAPDGIFSVPYQLKLGITIPKDLREKEYPEREDALADNYNTAFRYQETDHWFIVAEQYQLHVKFCFYDKVHKIPHVVAGPKDIVDPFHTGLLYFWRGSGSYLYALLDDESSPAYKQGAKSVGEGINPIIFLAKTR